MVRARGIGAAVVAIASLCAAPAALAAFPPVLRIAGNHFVGRGGKSMRIFAVHFGTSEYTCVEPLYDRQRQNVFEIPTSDAVLAAITTWHVNAIRIPLNEQCWLGVNPVIRHGPPNYGITPLTGAAARRAGAKEGRTYRSAIAAVVNRAHRHGMAAILDLHWSAAGGAIAWNQWPLPDRDHSIRFWRSVATQFKNDRSVAFEIFNEPFMQSYPSDRLTLTWKCLRDGCRIPNACADCGGRQDNASNPGIRYCGARCPTEDSPLGTYVSAGTQQIVDTIRATGARQPILVPGRDYTNDLGQWLRYEPRDPLHPAQIAATFHSYQGLRCDTVACWNSEVAPVAKRVPVVTTEFGGDTSNQKDPCPRVVAYDDMFMDWADGAGVSLGAFSWDNDYSPYDNAQAPNCVYSMLASWDGTPRYGQGQAIHDHFVNEPAQ